MPSAQARRYPRPAVDARPPHLMACRRNGPCGSKPRAACGLHPIHWHFTRRGTFATGLLRGGSPSDILPDGGGQRGAKAFVEAIRDLLAISLSRLLQIDPT